MFSKERSRITTLLNNKGYYNFTENYIVFKIDSNLTNYTVDVAMKYPILTILLMSKLTKDFIVNIM